MGNQTSQWFALYYLDGLDRLVKEKLRIRYYTRYMDDMILLHHDREVLKQALVIMTQFIEKELCAIERSLNSYMGHLSYGNTYHLRKNICKNFVLTGKGTSGDKAR